MKPPDRLTFPFTDDELADYVTNWARNFVELEREKMVGIFNEVIVRHESSGAVPCSTLRQIIDMWHEVALPGDSINRKPRP